MKKLFVTIATVLSVILCLLFFYFSLQNIAIVSIDLIFIQPIHLPLSVLLIAAFLMGAILTLFFVMLSEVGLYWKNMQLRAEVRHLSNKIEMMRKKQFTGE